MRKVWILAANRTCARVFRAENTHKLVEIKTIDHKQGHEHAKDLTSDRQGRQNSRRGYGVDTLEAKTTTEEKDSLSFAKQIAEMLKDGEKSGCFERLYLVCNPPFVSILRDCMSKPVLQRLEKEVHKDLTRARGEEIREHLPPVL